MIAKEDNLLLNISDVSKRFNGLHALKRISLSIRNGETIALIGPNGAGKTTLFNVITASLRPDSGSVIFRGKDITRLSVSDIARAGLVRVFQKPRIFPNLSVWENVEIGSAAQSTKNGRIAERTQELVQLAGLFTERNQLAGSLSFGKKRFLELIRALAVVPSLLLLDEPAAGLSPSEQDKLIILLKNKLFEGKLQLLFIEHRPSFIAELATRVVILNNGQKVFEGPAGDSVTDTAILTHYTRA
jgi:branched-chain amino acid transport system ATP-binding protein